MPDQNIFSTASLLLASWIHYSERNRYLGYADGKFHFADGEHTIQFLINGFHGVNPQVDLKKYESARGFLVRDRQNSGGAL